MAQQPTQPTPSPSAPASSPKVAIIAGIIVVCIGLGIYLFSQPSSTPTPSSQTTQTQQQSSPTPSPVPTTPPTNVPTATSTAANPAETNTYKNGTYTAEGDYISPAGPEKLKVTLTLSNDVVTDATVVSEAQNPMSQRYQAKFISGFKQLVVGQKISNLQLSNVSGSSLTPHGFNDAVQKIKTQAQA